MIFTQAECDEYLTTITKQKLNHDWRSGVEGTYPLHNYSWDAATSTFINPVTPDTSAGDKLEYVGPGAHGFFANWKLNNGASIDAFDASDSHSFPWTGWDTFTNNRSAWDEETSTMGEDIGKMESTHATMLATVE